MLLLLLVVAMACSEPQKSAPTTVSKDSASPKNEEAAALPDSNLQTPYTCALRSLRAMESGNLSALIPYVHPTKGLTISHVDEYMVGHERPFSVAELKAAAESNKQYTVFSGYEGGLRRKISLAGLLQLYSGSKTIESDTISNQLFSASKDVRRNYTGNGTYTLQPPLAAGQTTISFHISNGASEMNWQELVLRTETYQGKDYLVEILRAYWTP